MQNYFGPFILANENHTIRNTVVISSCFGLQLIIAPFNFQFFIFCVSNSAPLKDAAEGECLPFPLPAATELFRLE